MNSSICAIIVTFNRRNLLEECINSIRKQSTHCDIFVVNNSTDTTEEYLIENKINHITTEKNVGGAGGFNLGIKEACARGYDYLWLMDDDCVPTFDALEHFLDADRVLDSKYGFLASKVIWTDGNLHAMNKVHCIKEVSESIYEIKQATFVSMFVKTDVIKKIGLPIKEFFIWGDDIEFTRRIAVRNSIKSYYVDNSIVLHKTKNNIGSKIAFDDINNIDKYYYAYRNEAYLYRQEKIRGKIYYVKCIYNLFRIVFLSNDNRGKRIRVLLKGVVEGNTFNPEIEYLPDE